MADTPVPAAAPATAAAPTAASTTNPPPTALSSSASPSLPSAAEPSLWSNIEQTAQRLAETRNDSRARLKLVLQIREALDITQTADVDAWLRLMFGPLTRALSETRPAFSEADVDHRIRAALLEILNRLPLGDSLRPYSGQLCSLATRQLAIDNEENGLTCIRILFDCHKHYHPTLEAEVQPFIQFFTSLYTNWETNVKYHFNEQFNQLYNACMAAIATQQGVSGTASVPLQLPAKQLCKASESLKCASESPLVVMMLLQNYQRYVDASVPQLIPLLIKALTQPAHKEPPPLPAALVNALTPSTNGDGTPAAPLDDEKAAQDRATLRALERERDSRFRAALSDFYTAQVKCVSFIAHIFRGYAQHIQTQQDTLAVCVVQLLQNCPGEFPSARKDLLVAIRHMLLSDFKKALLRQAPKLLDEKLLIGEGKLVFDTLRPLAYATLADVVHQIKGELSLQQLSRIVYVFSRNLHDTSLPLSVQSQSVRILLNLVDQIHRSSDATDGRHNGRALLVRILHTLTAKLEALQAFIPKLTAHIQRNSTAMLAKIEANTNTASGVTYPTLLTLPSPTPVSSAVASKGEEELEDVIRELRLMISTMVMGMKTVLWCMPERDTRVLTDAGFLFLSQVEALEKQRRSAGQRLLYACYDTATQAIVYRPGQVIISKPPERWVDFTQADTRHMWDDSSDDYGSVSGKQGAGLAANRLTLRTTPEHLMYVQLCRETDADERCSYSDRKQGGAVAPPLTMPARELAPGFQCTCAASACAHGWPVYRMFVSAPAGIDVADVLLHTDHASDSPVVALGLCTDDALCAFLELYGYWLGNGSLAYRTTDGGYNAVVFSSLRMERDQYLHGLLDRLALRRGRDWRLHNVVQECGQYQLHIVTPCWFAFFDAEYGLKYRGSEFFDCIAAVAKQSGICSVVDDEDMPAEPWPPVKKQLHIKQQPSFMEEVPVQPSTDEDDPSDPETPIKSVRWFFDWVLTRLDKSQLRLLIEGLRHSDGQSVYTQSEEESGSTFSGARCIGTSSVQFRERLLQLCLHAGYSAHFDINTKAGDARGWCTIPSSYRVYQRPEMDAALLADPTLVFEPICSRVDSWWVWYREASSELLPAEDVRFDGAPLQLKEQRSERPY